MRRRKNALGTVLLPQLQPLADDGVDLLGEFTRRLVEADGDWTKISEVMSSTVQGLASSLLSTLPSVLQAVEDIVGGLGSAIMANLPLLVESATQIVVFLVQDFNCCTTGADGGRSATGVGVGGCDYRQPTHAARSCSTGDRHTRHRPS